MALNVPAPLGIKIKELHGKNILITMCLFWLEARFAFCDEYAYTSLNHLTPGHYLQRTKGRLRSSGLIKLLLM